MIIFRSPWLQKKARPRKSVEVLEDGSGRVPLLSLLIQMKDKG